MTLFLTMNGADYTIQLNYPENDIYVRAGSYPISQFLVPILQELSLAKLILLERFSWWFHIFRYFYFLKLPLLFKTPPYFVSLPQYILCKS